jgi:hypothetical protein
LLADSDHGVFLFFINVFWQWAKIPRTVYQVRIISVFKKEKRNVYSNYRGINIVNAGYKLYTKLINKSLQIIAEAFSLADQFGLGKGCSCINFPTLKIIVVF